MNYLSRKDFFKKACFSGVCLCGFSAIGLSHNNTENSGLTEEPQNNNTGMQQAWISVLLTNFNKELDEEEKKRMLKSCSVSHYENLKMDEILKPFINDLDKFIEFLVKEWGWKVDYSQATSTLIANENKNYCVCPMINNNGKDKNPAICYCSEGFAEKMFSLVAGQPASANVISSIQKGDKNCIYKIVFK